MSNELIINSTGEECRIALLKNRKLVEYHRDTGKNSFNVGDIFFGNVKKIVPGLNAAFVDLGYEKDAFLHYHDLGPQILSLNKYVKSVVGKKSINTDLSLVPKDSDIHKLGKISQVLTKNQKVLVQVVKEPISTKGPRLSCELSIAGRYVILVPFSDTVNVSKKIADSTERKRLVRIITAIKPLGMGVIIRTVAKDKEVKDLDQDIKNLVNIWKNGIEKLTNAQPKEKIIGEINKANTILRDILNETFDSIVVDDKKLFEEIKSFIAKIAPEQEKATKLYTARAKIFEAFGVEKQIKTTFGKSVSIPNGGYLIIEHTEAMHVIDVNSGNKSNSQDNQEDTALNVNLEATEEIARQLRLRDMGGIIVVDFIDMKMSVNRNQVFQKMKEVMKDDRSKHTILPLSKFGIMQITRQRVRPEMNISTQELCPSCEGSGKITATIKIADSIESHITFLLEDFNHKKISITLHPFLYAYFTKGIYSKRVRWFFRYKKWVRFIEDTSLPIMEYHVYDTNGEEIIL